MQAALGSVGASPEGSWAGGFVSICPKWCCGRRRASGRFLLSVQVLFCYEQFDELTLLHLREFDKKKLISVETDIVVDHYKEEKFEESQSGVLLAASATQFGAAYLE